MWAGWQFWVDRGGTFTDIVGRRPNRTLVTHKLLSEDPARYADAAVAGIKQLLGVPLADSIPDGLIETVKIGTTVATNALLERKGEPTLLIVNRGFKDALAIGDQTRPRLFDLNVVRPSVLYKKVIEIAGRVDCDGAEIEPLDEAFAQSALRAARAEGFSACAIVFLHAWKYPDHERRIAALARAAGFTQVSASHEVSPLLRLIPRGDTTVVDAYLSPVLRRYVDGVSAELGKVKLYFIQSNGGLIDALRFQGKDAVLSGPAGGIVGAARTAATAGLENIIGFDMGGTSTDVALYAGAFQRTFDTQVAGVRIRAPMMAIHTVAAGGGSILHFDGARFRVGPDSAGANPGPASYRRGGPLTITDANICLGKIQPKYFPAIFGSNGDEPLDANIVRIGFDELAERVSASTGIRRDPRDVAEGFVRIAVVNMANAIKHISVEKGHDVSRFALHCFGGAGGQHACFVADELGIDTVFIHPFAGVLSAYGIGLADQTVMREQSVELTLIPASVAALAEHADALEQAAITELAEQDVDVGKVFVTRKLHVKYQGTDAVLLVPLTDHAEIVESFSDAHLRQFGFITPDRPLIAETILVEAIYPGETAITVHPDSRAAGVRLEPIGRVEMWSGGCAHDAPVYERSDLRAGDELKGPALIRESAATSVVEPDWALKVTEHNNIELRRHRARAKATDTDTRAAQADPVLLELFNNIFMNIAEHAGTILQNTSRSVNIKERLDFSCAIFDAEGNLVANAPHVPVHLGAMGESVRTVLRRRGATLRPGDVIALNNPFNGGTHLPDITVITPVFDSTGQSILFFVGSRGHHADIGGLTPGSTPPDSHSLEEEGVVIDDFLLLDRGEFRETEFRTLLTGARYPARNPDMNIADIKAQVASNETSVQELNRIVSEWGWDIVAAYMRHVMDNAEEQVRKALARLRDCEFSDTLDNGAPLRVKITVDRNKRSAVIDFTGTGPQQRDNFNAPPAVTRAVVLYVFRCLVGEDIPLNEGCLKPLHIVIPPGTFLSPAPGAAVVAGNTEVSQAVCNVLFGALGVLASGQGTMNNFLFGNETYQYYETICGGGGAGMTPGREGFDGASAVQVHMTNTRMTDPEILELRYPVRLVDFSIRRGSGGRGRWHGGDGAVRKIAFLEPMIASLVTSRRKVAPFGLSGGADGLAGRQWVEHADGSCTELASTARVEVGAGDIIAIGTPGGGGFGAEE
jgi:5-oxoprolinase (ATP-hydrolysing)